MKNQNSFDLNLNIILTIDPKNKTPIKIWTDNSVRYSAEELIELELRNQANKDSWLELNKSKVDTTKKNQIVNNLVNQIDLDRHHYLITWTYGTKKMGQDETKVLNDIKNIRYRVIKLFYQNFKGRDRRKPNDEFPNQYYFLEKHKDGQYHIHLLMESIDPDLMASSLDKDSFFYRYNWIRSKILNRPNSKKKIITQKMIDRYPDYLNHKLVGRTYDSISIYDDWMISRFICEYMIHYQNDQRWGLSNLSNSPENIHSKVVEDKIELRDKIGYLNKDRYFVLNSEDYLGHLVPQYSDYQLQP
jgi:hypothetical protein